MKYKLPRPEDYPDAGDYKYKLAEAYVKLYSGTQILLISLEGIVSVADDVSTGFIKEKLEALLNQYRES